MLKDLINGIKYGTTGNRILIISEWVISALYDLSPLLFSIIWAYLIDTAIEGIQNDNLKLEQMIIPFALYAILETVKSIFSRLRDYLQNRIFDRLETKVHTEVIGKYASLDVQSLEDPEVNRLFQIIRGPYEWRIRELLATIGKLLSAILLILSSSAILFGISPMIFFIVIVSSIPSLILNMKFSSIGWGIWREDADKQRKFNLNREFLLNRDNLIEASVNNIAPHLVSVIKSILDNYHKKRKPLLRNRAVYMFLADLVRVAGSVLSVYILIQSALSNTISVGELILGASIFLSFSTSLGALLYEITETHSAGLFITDFLKFMNLKPKVKQGNIKIEKYEEPPLIEFKNVSFKYPNTERLILDNVSLEIQPGMKVALVGENGAGKTTLIKLLVKFYDITSGQILINGDDLSDIESESWERNIGLLTQHFNTYKAFSVEDNIKFGDINKESTNDEIFGAAEKARVTSFVRKYPNKFKQLLSAQFDDGVDPSWGQWQRIGIARTLFRNPPIIILDEPTSAIDAQAEFEIFQNINKQTEGKTVIYVSHRYSTVRNADVIFVLKDSKIIESGNHQELLEEDGEYAKNFKLQASGYK